MDGVRLAGLAAVVAAGLVVWTGGGRGVRGRDEFRTCKLADLDRVVWRRVADDGLDDGWRDLAGRSRVDLAARKSKYFQRGGQSDTRSMLPHRGLVFSGHPRILTRELG